MKIGFFITARLKSERLVQKILLDLNGKSILDRVIERAKSVVGIDGVVLCTSTNPQDSVLYSNAQSNQIQFYPGSEDDVLKRLLDAAMYYGYDAFVSITADNPLFSIHTSNILVDMYKRDQFDLINTKGLPMGCNTNLIDVKTLQIVNFIKQQSDTEIWGPFINRPDFFNVADLNVMNSPIKDSTRITIDYAEDYNFIRQIYKHYAINAIPDLSEVLNLLSDNKELLSINAKHKQKLPTEQELEILDRQFNAGKKSAVDFARSIEKNISANYSTRDVLI